jgi:acetyl-CoA/propionyl-CoA carboxylase biotin carboxyl carrier protein
VSEEVTGIDLVREQFRIANGERLDYDDPEPHAHSIEFRINGEDAGRGFLPAPGTVTRMVVPHGPGVRWDAGIVEGDTVAGAFDSMIAKLIVTGRDRTQALERARRALGELEIDGMPTVTPFHRAVVADPAFAPADPTEKFTVHTRWIETEFDNQIPAYSGAAAEAPEAEERQTVVVEVGGRRLEVSLPGGLAIGNGAATGAKKKAPKRSGGSKGGAAVSGDSLTAPMQGTIVKIAVEDGATVAAGDLVVVLEAMKMEQPITAHKAGVVSGLTAAVGETVTSGAVLAEIKDAEA